MAKHQFQPTVLTAPKAHGAFLFVYFDEQSKKKTNEILISCCGVSKLVKQTMKDIRCCQLEDAIGDESDLEVSIAFGIDFLCNYIIRQHRTDLISYPSDLIGEHGGMPKTNGDLFLHVKSEKVDACFDMCNSFVKFLRSRGLNFTCDHVSAFSYRKNLYRRNNFARDFSNFEDGTANPNGEELKINVLSSNTKPAGSCFALTQKWIHRRLPWFEAQTLEDQEQVIGRSKIESKEFEIKSPNSHLARITITSQTDPEEELNVVRQSQSFGDVNEHGLLFIAFSSDLERIDRMLYRMVGKDKINGKDAHHTDHIMKFSDCVTGQYWYVPSTAELESGKILDNYLKSKL